MRTDDIGVACGRLEKFGFREPGLKLVSGDGGTIKSAGLFSLEYCGKFSIYKYIKEIIIIISYPIIFSSPFY